MRTVRNWALGILGGGAGLLLLGVMALYGSGAGLATGTHDVELHELGALRGVTPDLERGAMLARTRCTICHGADLGGEMFVEDGAFATIAATNLTSGRGGVAGRYELEDWVRALRHGVAQDGRAMFVMPAEIYVHLGAADLVSLVGYLEQAPPVDRELPPRRFGLVGRMLLGAGQLDPAIPYTYVDHAAPLPGSPAPAETPAYGAYVAASFGCPVCHGEDLAGGMSPGEPPEVAPNLTPGGALGAWDEAAFMAAVRGREGQAMPWRQIGMMPDVELRALWQHLSSLPARPTPPLPPES